MIPAGYLAKRIASRPDSIKSDRVIDVYSLSSHVSQDFADYINYWKHNGYWLFDSPEVITQLAKENSIHLEGSKLFYYEVYDLEYVDDQTRWRSFQPELSFKTNVTIPTRKVLEGFDVVTFYAGSTPECSPLSCNSLADEIMTNPHCLLPSLQDAINLLEGGKFAKGEPGPYRIFAVYSVE